jgi:hypothetical protein
MFTARQGLLVGFLNAAPVNLALVMAVLGYPDHAWDIIAGAAAFVAALLMPAWPLRKPRR